MGDRIARGITRGKDDEKRKEQRRDNLPLFSHSMLSIPFRFVLGLKVFAVSSVWLLDVLDVADAAGNGDGNHR